MKFARRIVTSLTGLLILFWGWTFFIDAYNDLQILLKSEVWNDAALWTIFLLCLGLFLAGLVLWGAVMMTATYVLGKTIPKEQGTMVKRSRTGEPESAI